MTKKIMGFGAAALALGSTAMADLNASLATASTAAVADVVEAQGTAILIGIAILTGAVVWAGFKRLAR